MSPPRVVDKLGEAEAALRALLLCARWQLREGQDHHPKLRAAVAQADAALRAIERPAA